MDAGLQSYCRRHEAGGRAELSTAAEQTKAWMSAHQRPFSQLAQLGRTGRLASRAESVYPKWRLFDIVRGD